MERKKMMTIIELVLMITLMIMLKMATDPAPAHQAMASEATATNQLQLQQQQKCPQNQSLYIVGSCEQQCTRALFKPCLTSGGSAQVPQLCPPTQASSSSKNGTTKCRCQCQPDFYRLDDGRCVSAHECLIPRHRCPANNSDYYKGCTPTCRNLTACRKNPAAVPCGQELPARCPLDQFCVPADPECQCQCKPGFALNGFDCVRVEQCPRPPACPENSDYFVNSCESKCGGGQCYGPDTPYLPSDPAKVKCVCVRGFSRHPTNGKCIRQSDCPAPRPGVD